VIGGYQQEKIFASIFVWENGEKVKRVLKKFDNLALSHTKIMSQTQVFLVFLCPRCKCWDGSQLSSKLPLHASHVALPN
jgi:hypothetical protein